MASTKKYFGTDGIRGKAGEGKLSVETIAQLAKAIGKYLSDQAAAPIVLIGRDTRQSGDWIETSLVDGLTAFGAEVRLLGVAPTAAISYLAEQAGANLGIMITASHNPYWDNGIKFFGPNGRKIDDETELAIEALLDKNIEVSAAKSGAAKSASASVSDYLEKIVGTLDNSDLSGLSIVLDCANGAAFETGPAILKALGAEKLTLIGNSPDGTNINRDCGSTHLEVLCKTVKEQKAHIGIALDGDADRLIMCDEKGEVIDGDQIMGALALAWNASGRLNAPLLVSTVMSNLGLERLIAANDMTLLRTAVGDRHVAAEMQQNGYNLGGEQSGHILMPDYLPTGDGMLAAIQILSILAKSNRRASEALRVFEPVPQLLVNVRFEGQSPLSNPDVIAAIQKAEEDFEGQGRLLIRASGTEPLIRVMAEGDDPERVHDIVHNLADVIRKV